MSILKRNEIWTIIYNSSTCDILELNYEFK